MKKVALFLFFALCGIASFAQTQVVEAKTSATTCKRMSITYQGGVAYVHRENIPFNSNATSGASDAANLGIFNGRFVIPNSSTYPFWFVPFDTAPAMMAASGAYCPQCDCSGGSGTCLDTGGGKCKGITCDNCEASLKVCGGAEVYRGSYAIINASQIVFN